jgi:hypothetical protein
MGTHTTPRIGLAWSGNPRNVIDARHSIRLADWVEHLPVEFEYYRLQRTSERTIGSPRIQCFDLVLRRFFARFREHRCTSRMPGPRHHGRYQPSAFVRALGRPTWVLLAHTPDFRWLRDRNASPWYRASSYIDRTRPAIGPVSSNVWLPTYAASLGSRNRSSASCSDACIGLGSARPARHHKGSSWTTQSGTPPPLRNCM